MKLAMTLVEGGEDEKRSLLVFISGRLSSMLVVVNS